MARFASYRTLPGTMITILFDGLEPKFATRTSRIQAKNAVGGRIFDLFASISGLRGGDSMAPNIKIAHFPRGPLQKQAAHQPTPFDA
jgi:hypothetical protein